MEEKDAIGKLVRGALREELGDALAMKAASLIENEGYAVNTLRIDDLPKVAQLVDRLMREHIGYMQRICAMRKIQIIKPIQELDELLKGGQMTDTDKRREAELLVEIGDRYLSIRNYDQAIETYGQAAQKARWIDYHEMHASSLAGLGDTYVQILNWGEAEKSYIKTMQIAHKARAKIYEVRAYKGLGDIHWRRGELDKAEETLTKGLKVAEEHKLYDLQGFFYNLFGLIYSDGGKIQEGRECYLQAIPFLEKSGKLNAVALAFNNLADSYLQNDEPDLAIEYFKQCKEYSEKIHHERRISWALFNMGEAMAQIGDADGCIEACKEALPLAEEGGDDLGKSAIYRNLALGYSLKGDWANVDECLGKGSEIVEGMKVPHRLAYFNYIWGSIEIKRKNFDLAIEKLESARDLFEGLNSEHYIKMVDDVIAQINVSESG